MKGSGNDVLEEVPRDVKLLSIILHVNLKHRLCQNHCTESGQTEMNIGTDTRSFTQQRITIGRGRQP